MKKSDGALPVRPRGLRRTRDLAGHALRLCQPRADPLRAVGGFAQPSLPRRGRPRPEGAPRAVAGAARPAQFRCRSAGDGFGDLHHHRGRRRSIAASTASISPKRTRWSTPRRCCGTSPASIRSRRTIARTCRTKCARSPRPRAAPRRSIAPSRCWRWRPAPIRAPSPAPPDGRAMVGGAHRAASGRDHAQHASRRRSRCICRSRSAWAPDNKHARRSDPPRAGAARRSRIERLDLHRALRGVDRSQSL